MNKKEVEKVVVQFMHHCFMSQRMKKKYFIKNTNAPRTALIVYQQQIPQKKGMWKIHFSWKAKNLN